MRPSVFFAYALAGLSALASAQSTTPLLPSDDPFYVQPANISSYKLGDIVRWRNVTDNINGMTQDFATINIKSAYQFMYRSNDSVANAAASVMTFLTPPSGNSSRLLAYSVAYDSAINDCSPSYLLQKGANDSVGGEVLTISAALNNGWYVVTSDYEGLKAQFVAGVQAGHSVLDSIKASFNETARRLTGLSANAQYALFGYSGGALASEWAAEMAPTYAPTLTNFVGLAIGGVTPNVTSVLETVNGGLPGGLAFLGAQGLSNAFSNFSMLIQSQLKPGASTTEYDGIAYQCIDKATSDGILKDFFSLLKDGRGILYNNVVQTVLSGSGQMGVHGIPKMPLYVYKALGDEVSPVRDTTELVNKYCKAGATVEYTINPFGEHLTEFYLGTPAAYQWLKDRFDGVKPAPSTCSSGPLVLNVTSVQSAGDAVSSPIISALASLFNDQQKAGNSSFNWF